MGSTEVYDLPYPPAVGVRPAVPYWMQALAEAVEETILAEVTARTDAIDAATPKGRGRVNVTTDAAGYFTIAHQAPYTPSGGIAQLAQNTTQRQIVQAATSGNGITNTNITFRYLSTDGTSTANVAIVVSVIVWP